MKYRLTALLALAAIAAVPTVASAATMRAPDAYGRAPSFPYPTVVIPRDWDPTRITVNAEHNYLAGTCPTVSTHPGNYSAVLDQFCREFRG